MWRVREAVALCLLFAACASPSERAIDASTVDANAAGASHAPQAHTSAWHASDGAALDLGASFHGPSVASADSAGSALHGDAPNGTNAANTLSASNTTAAQSTDKPPPQDATTNATKSDATAQETPPVVSPAAPPPADTPPQAAEVSSASASRALATDGALAIHGSLSTQYRGRFADSQHDNDLYEFLALDVGDPTKDKWTAHLSARASLDLDGKPPTDTPPLFFSLQDTYDSRLDTQLYEAHVDGTDIGPFSIVKLGRVIDYETPVFAWFDGAYAQTKPVGESKLSFGAYGGLPVYLYESSRTGDVQGGLFAESKLWSQAKARLDWMHLEDTSSTGYHSDNVYRLGVWQDLGQNLHLDGNYSRLDGKNRDWSLRANWNDVEDDVSVQAAFYQLLEGQAALALPIDPFFSSLGELFPYYDTRLLVSKGFGKKVNVQAGLDIRRVTHDDDLGEFNRDFERYFLTGILTDVLPAELVLSVTGEIWDSDSTGIASAGADLSRRFSGKLDTSVGTYYSLYKTDVFNDMERDNVRTYYFRLRYRQGPSLSWDLRYELESVDPGPFNTLIAGLVWHF
jgi:hypothetical protein